MSISLTRILQQITGLNTFFAGPSASRDNGVVLLDTATVTWGTDGQGNIQATAAGTPLPTATGAGQVLTSTGAGTTYTAQALPVGSATQGGIVEVDGTTITATAGVISAVASASGAMVLIQEVSVSSSVTSVTFSSIPQTYKHLKLAIYLNSAEAGGAALSARFNGDSAADYSWVQLSGSGSSSGSGVTQAFIGLASTGVSTNDVFIPGYTNTTTLKRGSATSYDGVVGVYITGFSWSSTAAITSVQIFTQTSANILAGSVFSLYGIS